MIGLIGDSSILLSISTICCNRKKTWLHTNTQLEKEKYWINLMWLWLFDTITAKLDKWYFLKVSSSLKPKFLLGFPWWYSGYKSACSGHGFDPWSMKIPHAVEQLKPFCHNYWACAPQQEKPSWWEAHTLQLESSPSPSSWRKPVHSNEDPAQPKIKNLLKKWSPGDFPGGPVARTPRSQSRGPKFDPWSEN